MKGRAAELARAYAGKRVLLTGHTGFKGSWLAFWLAQLGAEVSGYALAPDPQPALFRILRLEELCRHVEADVGDLDRLRAELARARPHYVFHLAAQSLVRRSYQVPLETLRTNVLGTANLLEAIRLEGLRCAVVVVTSDKCYENVESGVPLGEEAPLGGHDIYSTSKGAAELVAQGYRRTFFPPARLAEHGVALATARAGNVIGGGDWATDRLVPDAVRALAAGKKIPVRNPGFVRPWQHVIEPLGGYLVLGARLTGEGAQDLCGPWNFGPDPEATEPVRRLIELLIEAWGEGGWEDRHLPGEPHEARILRLSTEKACARLGVSPRWTLRQTLERTAAWYLACARGASGDELRALCSRQIADYLDA